MGEDGSGKNDVGREQRKRAKQKVLTIDGALVGLIFNFFKTYL